MKNATRFREIIFPANGIYIALFGTDLNSPTTQRRRNLYRMKHIIAKRFKPLLTIAILVSAIAGSIQHFNLAQPLETIAHDWQLTLTGKTVATAEHQLDESALQTMDPAVIFTPLHDIYTYIAIVLSALITAVLVMGSNRLIAQTALPALLCVAYVGFTYWQFYNDQVMVLSTPVIAILLSWTLCYTFLMSTEEKEKNKIRNMFSHNVSPTALIDMVEDFENYANAGNGVKETISVLIADVRGFTSISETQPPEQVVEILNFYFSKMSEAILTHNGTVDKIFGDKIMAVWGAPIKSDEHAIDCVKAGLEMLEKLKEVNCWLEEKGLPPFKIGIGINTGEAILGSVGHEQKTNYTVIGDTVNLASRLEGVTKQYGCEIIISEKTRKSLKDRIPCQVVDMIKVKGKANAIKIYSPLSTDAQISRAKTYDLHCVSELSHEAFTHYTNKRWDLAINAYQKIPNENLRKKFINRCEHFRLSPPPQDWDGATVILESTVEASAPANAPRLSSM